MGITSLFLALSPTKWQLQIIEAGSDFCPPGVCQHLESFWFVRTWVVWLASRGQRSRMLLNISQEAEKLPSRGNDPDQNVDNGEAENYSPEM